LEHVYKNQNFQWEIKMVQLIPVEKTGKR